jgi:hypothetical protein
MRTPRALHAADEGSARHGEAKPAPWFDVCLPLRFYSPSTGIWGAGQTRQVSRDTVAFVPSDATVSVGDVLQYVLVFPGTAGRSGAVASCRGRVLQGDTLAVVTIEHYRLQTAAAARGVQRSVRRRLLGQCDPALAS